MALTVGSSPEPARRSRDRHGRRRPAEARLAVEKIRDLIQELWRIICFEKSHIRSANESACWINAGYRSRRRARGGTRTFQAARACIVDYRGRPRRSPEGWSVWRHQYRLRQAELRGQ